MIAFARLTVAVCFTVSASACVSMPDFDNVEGTPEEFKQETASDLEAARRQLLAMVNAYKLDDPK